MKPLTTLALELLKSEITTKAERLVDRLVAKREFCAIAELATALPVDIVASAVGLPEDGRERMPNWAEQMFNCFGPINDRSQSAFPVLEEMMHYATSQAVRGKLKPGSWAEAIIDAVDRGEVDDAARPVMMIDYMGPSLDTTIYAGLAAVCGCSPSIRKNGERFAKIRRASLRRSMGDLRNGIANSRLFPAADTRLRFRWNWVLPAGSRAIAFYGGANRDERKFPKPNAFDVTRRSADHLAFGWGPHVCVGQHLARLEMTAIFRASATRVTQFHIEAEVRTVNNVLRGFSKLIISVK